MEISMFDKMQSLPLLQGLTLHDFNSLIVNMKLDFQQWEEGDVIASQGEACNSLVYVISGDFEAEIHVAHTALIFSETCSATPYLIEPYNLFGMKRTYERTYTFKTKGATFSISREFCLQRLLSHNIVRSNYINYLCNTLRKAHAQHPFAHLSTTEEKMIAAIKSYSLFPEGEKCMRVKMSDFASLIDETRLNVSGVLNCWKEKGLIELRRYGFTIKEIKAIK